MNWKNSKVENSKLPIFNLRMDWEKVWSNLSFTAENNMGNLQKAGHISALTWGMKYSISSNFKNLIMNWVKYVSHREK